MFSIQYFSKRFFLQLWFKWELIHLQQNKWVYFKFYYDLSFIIYLSFDRACRRWNLRSAVIVDDWRSISTKVYWFLTRWGYFHSFSHSNYYCYWCYYWCNYYQFLHFKKLCSSNGHQPRLVVCSISSFYCPLRSKDFDSLKTYDEEVSHRFIIKFYEYIWFDFSIFYFICIFN